MPTYEYNCEKCGTIFNVHATIKEKEVGLDPTCPKCGFKNARQVISAGMFIRSSDSSNFNPPNCAPNSGPDCCG